MRKVEILSNKNLYPKFAEIIRIGNEAVKKAKAENKKFGIPEYFYKNGKIYFITSSGEITTEQP